MDQKMTVGELCTRSVVYATEDMSVKAAANLMRDMHVGSLVVVREADAGRIAVGMLTDRDIAIVAVAREFDPQTLRVGDIMNDALVTARPSESVFDVLSAMRQKGVRRIPVTMENGVLVGIISLDDLLESVAEEMQLFVQAITRERIHEEKVRV